MWLDFYLMTMPGAIKSAHYVDAAGHGIYSFGIGLLEIGLFMAYTGLFGFLVLRTLSQSSLVPIHHPFVKESIGHEVPQ